MSQTEIVLEAIVGMTKLEPHNKYFVAGLIRGLSEAQQMGKNSTKKEVAKT